MKETAASAPAAMDDRSPLDVAMAAVGVIAEHSDLADDQAVLDRIFQEIRPASVEYLTTIARTNHSVFYHQLQELYEFGKELVAPKVRDEFCVLVGRRFAEGLLAESFHPLQQVALASDADFQKKIVEIIGLYAVRYTGDKYVLSADFSPDAIRMTAGYRFPERVAPYLQDYNLDPDGCFHNSASVIAGAIEHFVSRLTEGYDPTRFEFECTKLSATIRVPVRASDRFNYETLIQSFSSHMRALEERQNETVQDNDLRDDLILGSTLMRERWERIRRASRTDELILLRGESGTGKSLMARKIHELSARRDRPFVEVALTSDVGTENMIQSDLFGHEKGAFTGADRQKRGLFSLAHGGTIFLDEIGDATAELQAKLLRVLESSKFRRLGGVEDISVDIRVIAATNRDLEKMVEEGSFRRDLYYRLNVISLQLPPLRERLEDIPALADFLLARLQAGRDRSRIDLQPELGNELKHYAWPGNIRELDHALRQAVAMAEGEELSLEDFPSNVAAAIRGEGGALEEEAEVRESAVQSSDSPPGAVIDEKALRQLVRSCNPVAVGTSETKAAIPAHIDFARRTYLAILIDELGGDLALIGQFWDRGSEKTLRSAIRAFDLTDRLDEARRRKKQKKVGRSR